MTSAPAGGLQVSDTQFLEDYLTFALWQPAFMGHVLYAESESAEAAKACFGLQMYLNLEMALECLSKWYFALRDWKPQSEPLLWRFKTTNVRENTEAQDYTAKAALDELTTLPAEQMLATLKQPTDSDLERRGWAVQDRNQRTRGINEVLETLRRALRNRIAGEGDLVRAYNNAKHGLLVLRELPGVNDSSSAFLIAKVQKGQGGQSLIKPLGLSGESGQLRRIRDTTIVTCQLMAVLLAVIPWYYYSDLTWQQYKAQPDNLADSVAALFATIERMVASP